jgi:hypothetical protein
VPLVDPGEASVVVPWRGGYVSVPLPGAGVSQMPSDVGYLRVEMEPTDTRIIVDGMDAGPAVAAGNAARVIALPAGVHRVEVVRPGAPGWPVAVEILPGETSVLRWRQHPEPPPAIGGPGTSRTLPAPPTSPDAGGYRETAAPPFTDPAPQLPSGGHHVVPPRATRTRPESGDGYQVIPPQAASPDGPAAGDDPRVPPPPGGRPADAGYLVVPRP